MATDSFISEDWAEQARYDLDSARSLLASGQYIHVLFFCQQAVEKALQALIVDRTGELPPRTHNLPRLAKLAGVVLDELRTGYVAQLSVDYQRTRYPMQTKELPATPTREIAESSLQYAEELTQWLLSMLK